MPSNIPSPLRRLVGPVAAVVFLFLMAGEGRADRVSDLIDQLETSKDYKVRLSAALTLSKIADSRSIPAFIKALGDSDKTVRGVAAASLGKLISGDTPTSQRKQAEAALKKAADRDQNAFVRKQAAKAYEQVRRVGSSPVPSGGGTYVNIGSMTANTGDKQAMRNLMRQSTLKAFKKGAAGYLTDWPGGKDPSKRDLNAKKMHAFHVDGTLTELDSTPQGSGTIVSCKLSMLLATYPEKSMFGFLKGGAKVQAGRSERDVRLAAQDCVAAVVEDLITSKIIPTIQSRTP